MARTGQRQRPYDRIVTLWEQLREAWKRIDALKAECDWLARDRKGHVLPSRPRRRCTGTGAPRCIDQGPEADRLEFSHDENSTGGAIPAREDGCRSPSTGVTGAQ